VLGQDGLGLAPVDRRTAAVLRQQLRGWNGDPPGIEWDWSSLAEYLDRFDGKVAPNVATLVGHGTVRILVVGLDDRAPTDAELRRMQETVAQAMADGAVGLSAGLTYTPAAYASDDELVALCEAVRPFGGYYQPHHRNYGKHALEAYAASIAIGRRAGVPVHLTHAHLGYPVNRGRAGELLALVDRARTEGVDVTLDTYPYLAGNTYLHAYLPKWAHAGGSGALLARLRDPDQRARLRSELEEVGSDGFGNVPMDWDWIVVSSVSRPQHERYVGKSIAQAAAEEGKAPFDLYCDLLIADELGVSSLAFTGNEENVRAILQHPAHMAGSDGIVVGGRPHPRAWGTHARFLGHYVRELGLVRLEEMVRKMTSLPAQRLGLPDRGLLRPGAAADVVLFDPETVADTATYERPRSYPRGIPYVLVNGVVVKELDRHTGALPGRALRRGR
jgi:N-acyl-D-amino-acid deacylase